MLVGFLINFEHSVLCFSCLDMWNLKNGSTFSKSVSVPPTLFSPIAEHCWSVWEFDYMPLNGEHIVAYWIFRGIWRTITFNVILTINNATSKNLPSSVTNWLQIGVQYPTLWRTFNLWYYHAKTTICIFWLWYFQESLTGRTYWMFVQKYLRIKLSACQIKKMIIL